MSLAEKVAQLNCVFPFDGGAQDYEDISAKTSCGIGEVSTLEMRRIETLEEAGAWQGQGVLCARNSKRNLSARRRKKFAPIRR